MTTICLDVVRMDVREDKEALFNAVYDGEHVPALQKVAGVRHVARYLTSTPGEPRYLAMYELRDPRVLESPEWKAAAEAGRWPAEIRPYLANRHRALYVVNPARSQGHLTYLAPFLILHMTDVSGEADLLISQVPETPPPSQAQGMPSGTSVQGWSLLKPLSPPGPPGPGAIPPQSHQRYLSVAESDSQAVIDRLLLLVREWGGSGQRLVSYRRLKSS